MSHTTSPWVRSVAILLLDLVALAVCFVPGWRLYALVPLMLSLLLWGLGRSTIGTPPASTTCTPTVAEVRHYRQAHPGASLSDAVRAVERSRS